MCHVQWATISNIQDCLFQGDVDDCLFMHRKTVYWYRLMAMPYNYKQRCTDGFRGCAWRLSCSPWTWIFVSIAEMVALPCVSIWLCEHIADALLFWQTTFQKAALRHVVSRPLSESVGSPKWVHRFVMFKSLERQYIILVRRQNISMASLASQIVFIPLLSVLAYGCWKWLALSERRY